MPPRLPRSIFESRRNLDELLGRHVIQAIVIHNRPTARRLAVNDIAARRLALVLPVHTVAEIHTRDPAAVVKGREHLLGGRGLAVGEHGNEMEA